MLITTESKAQNWRAVVVFDDRPDALIFVGRSSNPSGPHLTECERKGRHKSRCGRVDQVRTGVQDRHEGLIG